MLEAKVTNLLDFHAAFACRQGDCLVNFLMYVCICLRSCKWVSTNLNNYIALIFKWKWFKKFQHDAKQFLKTVTILNMNFQKPLDVGASVCAKTITFLLFKTAAKLLCFLTINFTWALWQFEFFLLFGTCRKSFSRHLFCPFGLGKKKASQDLLNHRP